MGMGGNIGYWGFKKYHLGGHFKMIVGTPRLPPHTWSPTVR
jgi:hypothetical protein